MPTPLPFCRAAGSGPTVICLHSNASHSGQWRGLVDRLSDRFQVLAVDSYGSGKTADWPSDRTIELADEVALIEPLLAQASTPAYLVGHSYGAAVAIKAALLHPGRFGALAVYEPTLFSLVARTAPDDVDGIRKAAAAAAAFLEQGDSDAAARSFIDFWMGAGSWDAMPADRKAPMAASVRNVRRWAHALFSEPTTVDDLRTLDLPVLILTGGRSPLSSLSVAQLLMASLPRAERVELPSRGHMAPITHPEEVNVEIERFLARLV
jgi:pimeloyl-ACP methyl ester carboxylesterase